MNEFNFLQIFVWRRSKPYDLCRLVAASLRKMLAVTFRSIRSVDMPFTLRLHLVRIKSIGVNDTFNVNLFDEGYFDKKRKVCCGNISLILLVKPRLTC